ncbi:hypothetical protein QN358_10550 [Subtercola sp. RTI3]|nr:hypothetical protein [Subtercola sp. RTI3]
MGAVISVMHGVQQLFAPEPASDFAIAYVVLGVSAVLEGVSLVQSLVEVRRTS